MKTNIHFLSYLAQLFYNEKRFRQNCRENQNTHFVFNNFYSDNHTVYEIMWKNIVATDDDMTDAHCLLDT